MTFNDAAGGTGIVQQVLTLMRVDSAQWPVARIANSCNNYLDLITGYAIGADKRFQWDDTNHTKLPEGTADLTVSVSDYSFLTDQQGNKILTLLGISVLDSGTGLYKPISEVDRSDQFYDPSTYGVSTGTPTEYDKIADNFIRLNKKPIATISNGIKFYFQRSASYFTASDTTKEPGVAILLHRGFVIAAAYDGALALGLANTNFLAGEMQKEIQKMVTYFSDRNRDVKSKMKVAYQNNH